MKRRSPLSTLVGAVPGALPPLIGWTASHGASPRAAWRSSPIVFIWQIPHFMAIAWLYRDDYGKAGFPMLPVIDPEGRRAGRQAVVYAAALAAGEPRPLRSDVSGDVYLAFAAALGLVLLWLAVRFAPHANDATARALFSGHRSRICRSLWVAMIADNR